MGCVPKTAIQGAVYRQRVYNMRKVKKMIMENKYLRKAVAKAGYIIVVLESSLIDGSAKVKYISPNASNIGINVELLNKGTRLMQDYVHPEDRKKVIDTMITAVGADIQNYIHEYRMVDDEGNIYNVVNDMTIADVTEESCTVECYIKDITAKKKEKKTKKEKKREQLRASVKTADDEITYLRKRATKDKIPDVMDAFARAYGLYTAFVNVKGEVSFPPTGPSENLGDFYDLFETPAYKEYFKFMLERVKASDGVVVFDREEGGVGKLSAVKLTAMGEIRGVWILGSYTAEEAETLKEIGEDQQLLAEVLSDYTTKSVTLELESAKYKGAGVKLREELARQGIINDALRKINSGITDAVDVVIEDTLRDVGLNMNIENVALYKYGKANSDEFELRNFWDIKGEEPSDEYVYGFPKRKFRIESQLDENSEYYIADSSNMTESTKTSLMKYNLKAVIIYPIYRNNKIYGMLLFGDTKENRTWTPEEIRFAKSITIIIQSILENAEGDDNIRNVNKHLIETYNNFTVGIFVRDAYSGEILFSNKVMNQMMDRDFVGGNSREIITDLHDRYDDTTGMRKAFITRDRVNSWRSYIKRFDSIMDITEISIEWLNGEPASLIVLRDAKDA
jgi:hypothetical protein